MCRVYLPFNRPRGREILRAAPRPDQLYRHCSSRGEPVIQQISLITQISGLISSTGVAHIASNTHFTLHTPVLKVRRQTCSYQDGAAGQESPHPADPPTDPGQLRPPADKQRVNINTETLGHHLTESLTVKCEVPVVAGPVSPPIICLRLTSFSLLFMASSLSC